MAHFAEIDGRNVVLRVVVVADDVENGETWCARQFGGTWRRTHKDGSARKNFAGVGYTLDAARDAFVPPKPYPSWELDEATCRWSAPTPYPDDAGAYVWDEDSLSWVAA